MEFYETIAARRSIRAYKNTPVSDDALRRILEAARLAPSWCNRQCWRIIVVSDPAVRNLLGQEIANPDAACYENAPYVLVVCADPSDSGHTGGKEYYLADCAIAMEHMVLAATAEGLGTCWVGAFSEFTVRNILSIPKEVKIVGITPLGHPDEAPSPQERKPLAEITYQNAWQGYK